MSGTVRVRGNASQSAGATAHGGLLVDRGRCRRALRDLHEGHRHRRRRQHRAYERIHGPGRSAGRLRRRRGRARRLPLRGPASTSEARCRSLGADCVEKPMRAEHLAELARAARSSRIRAPTRASSGATARPASSTTSRSTTPRPTDADRHRWTRAASCGSPRPSTAPPSPKSSVPPRPASTTSAAAAPSGSVPHFDDLLFLGASMSRYPLEGYRETVRHRRRAR